MKIKTFLTTLTILLLATASYVHSEAVLEVHNSQETQTSNHTEFDAAYDWHNLGGLEGNTQTYIVERVIDGDTIKLTNGERVSLIGVDAPEVGKEVLREDGTLEINVDEAVDKSLKTGQDLETILESGEESRYFLTKLLEGKEVRLEFDVQEKDKYGRLLAYVLKGGNKLADAQCDNFEGEIGPGMLYSPIFYHLDCKQYVFINATLVTEGYATPMTIPPNVKHADLFKKLYEEAREQKRGLWKNKDKEGEFCKNWDDCENVVCPEAEFVECWKNKCTCIGDD